MQLAPGLYFNMKYFDWKSKKKKRFNRENDHTYCINITWYHKILSKYKIKNIFFYYWTKTYYTDFTENTKKVVFQIFSHFWPQRSQVWPLNEEREMVKIY